MFPPTPHITGYKIPRIDNSFYTSHSVLRVKLVVLPLSLTGVIVTKAVSEIAELLVIYAYFIDTQQPDSFRHP